MNEETKEVIEDDDIIMPDDIEDMSIDDEAGNEENLQEEQASNSEEKPQQTEEEKLLEYLNTKEIKYNGEKVKVPSIDVLIDNYEKVLNYDKLKTKNETEQNAVMSYISEMASKAGLTPTQYIDQVKAYQKQKEQETMEADIQKMVSNGVDEETARRVARTEAALNELEREKAELQKQREESEKKAREDKEY